MCICLSRRGQGVRMYVFGTKHMFGLEDDVTGAGMLGTEAT